MLRSVARVAAAVLVTAAAYAAVPTAPASAAACSSAHGVTVVVDFHELGGGVQTGCVADGGGQTASQLFPAAGFPLDYVQRQPGFVCRVSGKPADDPCVNTPPADAYWALFWSDGRSGSWTYATSGAGGQRVPDGGYVGFSWNGSSARTAPGYSPAPHPSPSPSPTPTPTHTTAPTHAPSAHASSSAPPASASATPTQSASATPTSPARARHAPHSRKPEASESPSRTPTASATPSASPSAVPASSDPTDPGGGGLPGWVAPAVIVALFGAAGGVAVVRRRRGAA